MTGRIRSIKPEWIEDERLNACSDAAIRLTFVFLAMVDDDGRCRVSTRALGLAGWKFCDSIVDKTAHARAAIAELVAARWVVSYEVDGHEHWQVRNFAKHQKISHYTASKLPSPPEPSAVVVTSPENSGELRSVPEPAGILRPDQDQDQDLELIRTGAPPPAPTPTHISAMTASLDPTTTRAIDAYRDGIGDTIGKRPPVNHSGRFAQAADLLAALDGTEADKLGTIRRAAAVAARDEDHRKANAPFAWFVRNVGRYSQQAETPDTDAMRAKLRQLVADEQAARMKFDHDLGDRLQAEANGLRRKLAGAS